MKPRIYMVDDEPDYQTILRSWLEPAYEVVSLKDGDELIGAMRSQTPDLVVLDVQLPGADGFELCRRLRASSGQDKVPVLFLTASHAAADYHRGIKAGGNGFVMKPAGRRQLLSAVADMIAEGRAAGNGLVDVGGGD